MASIPMGRAGQPRDFVGAALFLASDESAWVTGAKIVIDGGAGTY
jgi:NAD(P)-dependent dehydrogenase (short-subunit alcohol dehydrogenase family)